MATSTFELIDTVLPDGSTSYSSILFENIPQTYRDLQVRFWVGTSSVPSNSSLVVRLEGQETGFYATQAYASGGNDYGVSSAATAYNIRLFKTTDTPTQVVLDIFNYNDTSMETQMNVKFNDVTASTGTTGFQQATNNATTAITSIGAYIPSVLFSAGSRIDLYGIVGE